MDPTLRRELAVLPKQGMKPLQQRYLELFGEMTTCRNKVWLIKRIAWRLQARAEGGLSDLAVQRAAELADDAEPPRAALLLRRQHATLFLAA